MKVLTPAQETEFVKTGELATENECNCSRCKKMCQTHPCVGTPTEIIKLIQAGHINKLIATLDCAPTVLAGEKPVQIIAPLFDREKMACAFYNDGNCELHNSGLKPIEGKIANHANAISKYKGSYVERIMDLWNVDTNTYNVSKAWLMFAHAKGITV